MSGVIDLGSGYSAEWIGWAPDRSIPANAERYANVPDIERAVLRITCPHGKGAVHPDTPEIRAVFQAGPYWTVVSYEPLTIKPSIERKSCGCHGFITNGRWVPA